MSPHRTLGLKSGIGLVIANMVGAGVFLSTGWMAQSLSPGLILLAWGIGTVLALCGAKAYAEVARLVPEGGGEYRYLSALWHPALGYLAGWASLLLGFSAPTAVDAVAAGAFAHAVAPALNPQWVAAGLIVLLTGVHAMGLHLSTRVQNSLVVVKVALLACFVLVGVFFGSWSWPTWTAATPTQAPVNDVLLNLFFIAFAFSGWNAAIYAADEFQAPERNVPRAMLIGCLVVGALYLVVNYIFIANLTPAQGFVVAGYDEFTAGKAQLEQVTLGQAVMAALVGPLAAKVMSAVMVLLFTSAMSAMLLVGPRVYAAMAKDGFLPAVLGAKQGKPPTGAVLLQGALALLLIYTNDARSMLSTVGAILVLFAALTVAGLFVAKAKGKDPSVVSLICAGVYVLSAGWMLFVGFRNDPKLLGWIGGVALLGLGAFALTRLVRERRPA